MKLHIGSKGAAIPGFQKLDKVQWGDTEFCQDASNLSNFETGSVEEIYASHILEHFKKHETLPVLTEWVRVLKPGGSAYISVPDFDALVKLYIKIGSFTEFLQDWNHGGQEYETAVHYRSFTLSILSMLMAKAGFNDVKKIPHMPYGVADCSKLINNVTFEPISLCVRGIK
jgi:predicted SAM-dependent methyltransferase